jgi:hypothetical protein
MKTTLLACSVVLLSLCFNVAKGQTDSTAVDTNFYYYPYLTEPADSLFHDLGRIQLQKKFTQSITIKGADLEKMPFMDLRDALTVYYNGIYGAKQKFSYVVNGIINADVNAYSIFDIDEVTFVNSAANALNGITPGQVLVLVKTKRVGPDEWGIRVNGQTNAIRRYIPSIATTAKNADNSGVAPISLYHQYNLSFYTNSSWISAGLSANLQKNVYPQYRNEKRWDLTFKPYTSNRIKLNGFVDIRIDTFNVINFNAGYVPQSDREIRKGIGYLQTLPVQQGYDRTEKQNILFANVEYKSVIWERITNKFSAGFQRLGLNGRLTVEDAVPISDTLATITNFTIKDNIAYQFELGPLTLMPQLNMLYRQVKDTSSINYFMVLTRIRGYNNTQRIMTFTPSMTVNFKDMAVLQFGAQKTTTYKNTFFSNRTIIIKDVSGPNGTFYTDYAERQSEFNNSEKLTPILPFASLSFDFMKAGYLLTPKKKRPKVYNPTKSLMLYASFARSTSYVGDFYGSLADNVTDRQDPIDPLYASYNINKAYNQIDGGLTYALLKKGLSFSYNYSNSKFASVYYTRNIFGSPPPDSASLAIVNIETHRLTISYSTPGEHRFKWTTNLNGAFIMNKAPKVNYIAEQMRLFNSQKGVLTGGFVNQFSFDRVVAGFNILYGFNKPTYTLESANNFRFIKFGANTHVLNLQSAYAGYKFAEAGWFKSLEVFANGSNLLQKYSGSDSYRHYSFDVSRYFGGGFKLGL